jgi:hypothetical protein
MGLPVVKSVGANVGDKVAVNCPFGGGEDFVVFHDVG